MSEAANQPFLCWIEYNSFSLWISLNRVWIGLREVHSSYVGDSVEVLSALIIVGQTNMK